MTMTASEAEATALRYLVKGRRSILRSMEIDSFVIFSISFSVIKSKKMMKKQHAVESPTLSDKINLKKNITNI